MDKKLIKNGGDVLTDLIAEVFGAGPIVKPIKKITEGYFGYRYRRRIKETIIDLDQLSRYLSMRDKDSKREVTEAAIVSFFQSNEIALELLDDMISRLLNTPNEHTRPIIIWIYSRYIKYNERPSRIASRFVRMLLDCDKEEIETLKDLASNMKSNWNDGIRRAFIRVNLEGQEQMPIIYMSVAEDIEQVMHTHPRNDLSKWKSWPPGSYNYSAIIDMLKRFGVTREVPIMTSGIADTKTQMYISSEAALLLFDAFGCPDQ